MVRMAMFIVALGFAAGGTVLAGVGDPQVKTDHPWYPGELSCSTFDRLFKTQAELYKRVTGRNTDTDEDKALASWYWRNLNYFHCTIGASDLYDAGLDKGIDKLNRDYWSGLFGYGFGLCFTTHHQWQGEMTKLLGPCRSRMAGVQGHTSFEVWLTGGPYGDGQWVLLDHDISTVVFSPDGKRLLGIHEINQDMSLIQKGDRSRGWLPGGLHPSDPGAYNRFAHVGYMTGFATAPPMVHLRKGETLRRYLKPGLEDGKTWAYWGINYNRPGQVGPTRSRTWVDQPEKMYKTTRDCGHHEAQGQYGNAVYTYTPDFASGSYKEAVVDESDKHVTLEFYSPYVIAATPAPENIPGEWGIYKPGCTNGLLVNGKMTCPVAISTDQGKTWQDAPQTTDGMDLTDRVKSHMQYWIRFGAAANDLAGKDITIRTVCQCAPTVIPRVKAGVNTVTYESSGQAVLPGGPNTDQTRVVAGKQNSPTVTLELAAPRKAQAVAVYAAARVACGAPPRPSKYNIDCSTDGGKTWKPLLKDYEIIRRGYEPGDWWSQTFLMGDAALPAVAGAIQVRFTNSARLTFMRAEAHLVYKVKNTSPLKATFAWKDGGALQTASHTYAASVPGTPDATWQFDGGSKPETVWVEYTAE